MPEVTPSTSAPPEDVPAVPGPDFASALALQVGVVVIAALYFGREVLIPITLAILLSFVLSPVVDFLRRVGLGRVPAVLLSVALAIGIILVIGGVIGSQFAQLASNLPQYAGTVEKKVNAVRTYTIDRVSGLVARLDHVTKPKAENTNEGTSAPDQPGNPAPSQTQSAPAASPATDVSPIALFERYLTPILSPLATVGIIIIVAIFVLLQKEDLRDRLIRLFGATDLHRTTVAMDDAAHRLSRYFLALLIINTCFGTTIGIGLYFIGVPNPVLWGILSSMLRFVPYIGSFISAGLPILLAAAVDPGWSMVIWTAALYIIVELLVSQALEPFVYGHSTGLSPFAVIISAIFWSWLWGGIGLILSMPLTLCLVVLGRHVERLEFLDVLLGDRPALTPAESFYQRILAGDADEAQDHAELLLKQRSLSSYYDEVALKGMQLAANDAERGVLRPSKLERIRDTINALVEELGDQEDSQPAPSNQKPEPQTAGAHHNEEPAPPKPPPPRTVPERITLAPAWQTDAPVLCLAGRGPLDDAASTMLAQLLRKHGLGARVAPHEAASRSAIGRLDVSGVAMVCITYLDISGAPSHLRYLIRRLRRKRPGVPILVGLWPADDVTMVEERVRAAIGADYYTTSLTEAVNACVAAATKAAVEAAAASPAAAAGPPSATAPEKSPTPALAIPGAASAALPAPVPSH